MLSAITSAHESIYLEMYIFEGDTRDYDFLSALEESAKRGVQVKIILDALGSSALPKAAVERLRKAGAEVLFFSFLFRRTHRKMLVVDERIAFVGGVNIGKHFALWKDLQVRFSGKNVVGAVVRSFARMYRQCGGKDDLLQNIGRPSVLQKTKLWFVEHGVGERRHTLRRHYEERIGRAKKRIVLVTPYLMPPRWLLAQLDQALIRGVAVDVLVPRKTDHAFVDRANWYYVSFISDLGAPCHLFPEMNHAKAMLIDGEEGMLGSQNLDTLSFDWNAEAGVFFHEAGMVRDLTRIIEGWLSEAQLFDPSKEKKLRWYDKVLGFFLRALGFSFLK
mgnify:CR=1 FL=1